MRIKRKPLLLNAWHNSKGNRPGGKPAEPMPPWLKSIAERAAAPDTTFTIVTNERTKLITAGDVVYQAPDGSVHSVTLDRFKQEYDVVDLQPNKIPDAPQETKL
jgi:hypothetical protein